MSQVIEECVNTGIKSFKSILEKAVPAISATAKRTAGADDMKVETIPTKTKGSKDVAKAVYAKLGPLRPVIVVFTEVSQRTPRVTTCSLAGKRKVVRSFPVLRGGAKRNL